MDGSNNKLWYIRGRSIVLPKTWAKHYQYSFFAESKSPERLFSKSISPEGRQVNA
jgi:hypothetical protein